MRSAAGARRAKPGADCRSLADVRAGRDGGVRGEAGETAGPASAPRRASAGRRVRGAGGRRAGPDSGRALPRLCSLRRSAECGRRAGHGHGHSHGRARGRGADRAPPGRKRASSRGSRRQPFRPGRCACAKERRALVPGRGGREAGAGGRPLRPLGRSKERECGRSLSRRSLRNRQPRRSGLFLPLRRSGGGKRGRRALVGEILWQPRQDAPVAEPGATLPCGPCWRAGPGRAAAARLPEGSRRGAPGTGRRSPSSSSCSWRGRAGGAPSRPRGCRDESSSGRGSACCRWDESWEAEALMPKRRSVRSLEKLCLENVAGNMQNIWAKDYIDSYLDKYHFCYIMGPFSELAGSLVQELLHLLGESRRLTRAMLHLLLVPHLTELNLSTCPKLVSQAIAHLITVRCKSLSLLDLQGCSRVPSDALVDLMESLPYLTKLGLSETQCNTQVLSAVGSCCSRLHELDISDCKRLSPASLLHLAFDPTVGSFCCPMLQVLNVDGLKPSTHSQDMVAALAFLLLAFPSLKFLVHELVAEAVYLIHKQQFGRALNAPGFPSLEKLARCRATTHRNQGCPRLLLQLQRVIEVEEPLLPVVCAVCPHLAEVTILLRESSLLDWGLLSWHHLTHLTVNCTRQRPLRELLPATSSLGAQLHFLSLGGFSLEEEVSFPVLLSQCQHLKKFSASLLPPQRHGHGGEWGANGDFNLTPHKLPQLHDLSLFLCSSESPLDSRWAEVLKVSLVSLLRHSPHLEHLDLVCMPFSLDGVFEEVLRPPSTVLAHLRELSLAQDRVSSHTIHLLLSLDNSLTYLNLDGCPEIHQRDYDQLLRRISKEGLELNIVWA